MKFSESELLQIYEIAPRFVAIYKILVDGLPVDIEIMEWGFELVEIYRAINELQQKIGESRATLAYAEFAADASNREFGYSIDVETSKKQAIARATSVQPLFCEFLPEIPEGLADRLPKGYLAAGHSEFKKLQDYLEISNRELATLRSTIEIIQSRLTYFDMVAGRKSQSVYPI